MTVDRSQSKMEISIQSLAVKIFNLYMHSITQRILLSCGPLALRKVMYEAKENKVSTHSFTAANAAEPDACYSQGIPQFHLHAQLESKVLMTLSANAFSV